MDIKELTDVKTTINWLLENGDFKDDETSYNIAMNAISTIEEAINFIPCCTELCYEDVESTKCLTCGDETCLDAECLQ